ncbi:hypothetical protein Cgig2_015012 [Carnegiea gigantea]|uniref:Uncharacterized protein n=1 Tax=Carnegiea gigantea TaxID=171969 RepID=A0A9Q1JEY9_9CARY|nr:hypothetical protein Cgig2_015012 [Carnegiea gigantea]
MSLKPSSLVMMRATFTFNSTEGLHLGLPQKENRVRMSFGVQDCGQGGLRPESGDASESLKSSCFRSSGNYAASLRSEEEGSPGEGQQQTDSTTFRFYACKLGCFVVSPKQTSIQKMTEHHGSSPSHVFTVRFLSPLSSTPLVLTVTHHSIITNIKSSTVTRNN